MGLFEFKCVCRDKIVEVLKRVGTDPEFCPECGQQMEMQISAPARPVVGFGGKAGGYGKNYKLAHSSESSKG